MTELEILQQISDNLLSINQELRILSTTFIIWLCGKIVVRIFSD